MRCYEAVAVVRGPHSEKVRVTGIGLTYWDALQDISATLMVDYRLHTIIEHPRVSMVKTSLLDRSKG